MRIRKALAVWCLAPALASACVPQKEIAKIDQHYDQEERQAEQLYRQLLQAIDREERRNVRASLEPRVATEPALQPIVASCLSIRKTIAELSDRMDPPTSVPASLMAMQANCVKGYWSEWSRALGRRYFLADFRRVFQVAQRSRQDPEALAFAHHNARAKALAAGKRKQAAELLKQALHRLRANRSQATDAATRRYREQMTLAVLGAFNEGMKRSAGNPNAQATQGSPVGINSSEAAMPQLAQARSDLSGTPELLIFSDENPRVFLGCLSCSEYDSRSVKNEYGSFGNPYSSTSIASSYGKYGSAYSSTSACNQYATSPPLVVDGNGTYYGRLSLNTFKQGQLAGSAVIAWLEGMCAQK